MDESRLKHIIEALLMTSDGPISLDGMLAVFEDAEKPTRAELEKALGLLAKEYETRAIELKCLASGYRIQTKSQYSSWIARFLAEKPV